MEIRFPLHAGMFFQERDADFFGGARVYRGFIGDDGAPFHVLSYRFAGTGEGPEIGLVGDIHRRRDCNYDMVGLGQFGRVGGDGELAGGLEIGV